MQLHRVRVMKPIKYGLLGLTLLSLGACVFHDRDEHGRAGASVPPRTEEYRGAPPYGQDRDRYDRDRHDHDEDRDMDRH